MAKTITIRMDDNTYELFKKAAQSDRRTISNFIENAALNYLAQDSQVSDEEMEEILNDQKLVSGLKKGISVVKKGKYKIVG